MFTDRTEVFRWNGKKYAVTFNRVSLWYDTGRRQAEGDKVTHLRRVGKKVKRIEQKRKAILCIIRLAYTGTPYTGIAILHPDEKGKSDPNKASALAMKRAIDQMVESEDLYFCGRNARTEIYSAYREEMTRKYNPVIWADIQRRKQDAADRIAAREKARKDHARHVRWMTRVKKQQSKVNGSTLIPQGTPAAFAIIPPIRP